MSTHHSGQVLPGALRNSSDVARAAGVSLQQAWIPAVEFTFTTTAGNWAWTRVAANAYAMVHSNVDETSIIYVDISKRIHSRADAATAALGEAAPGPRLISVGLCYMNPSTGGSDLDAAPACTLGLATTLTSGGTYAAPTNPAGTDSGGSVTKSDTLVRVALFTLTTPLVIAADQLINAEWTFNSSATSDARVYGCYVNYDLV